MLDRSGCRAGAPTPDEPQRRRVAQVDERDLARVLVARCGVEPPLKGPRQAVHLYVVGQALRYAAFERPPAVQAESDQSRRLVTGLDSDRGVGGRKYGGLYIRGLRRRYDYRAEAEEDRGGR